MPSTYTPIAHNKLTAATATVTFSSIPATYTDLIVVANTGQPTSTGEIYLRANGDSGSNYSYTVLSGNGSSASSNRAISTTVMFGGALGINFGLYTFYLFGYSDSVIYKPILARSDEAILNTNVIATGIWLNQSPITSLTLGQFNSGNNNFMNGSTFTLYGIKRA